MFVLDLAAKVNYSSDSVVIGAMLNTTAVATYAIGLRLSQVAQKLTSQLNDALFPNVVDSSAMRRQDRLQLILLQGTKLSTALAAPVCLGLVVVADPLIHSWVGRHFDASVLPTQVLLLVVLLRVSTASANLILKGAGQHKLLTYTNVTTAIVNVLLSIVLIRPFGLVGVALGTLIPVTLATVFVIYPVACREVGLSIGRPLTRGILPALWPALIMVALLRLTQGLGPAGLAGVLVHLAAGGLVYLGLFVGLGLGTEERRFYWMKLRSILFPRRQAAAAV
jgi:O-antigen/teichoic acid export membrane protein